MQKQFHHIRIDTCEPSWARAAMPVWSCAEAEHEMEQNGDGNQ